MDPVLVTIHTTTHSISLSFTFITILILVLAKEKASVSLSLFTSIIIFVSHAFFLIGPVFGYERLLEEPLLCSIQVTGIHYTIICSVCWVFCRSIQLYLVAVLEYDPVVIGANTKYPMHIFSWFCPLIPVIIALLGSGKPNIYTYNYWCWISPVSSGIWRWTCFYAPLFVLLCLTIAFWVRSMYSAKQHLSKNRPVAFLLLQNMGGVILVIYLYLVEISLEIYREYNKPLGPLPYLHLFTYSTMGIICFISFGATQHTVKRFKQFFFQYCYKNSNYEITGI